MIDKGHLRIKKGKIKIETRLDFQLGIYRLKRKVRIEDSVDKEEK